MITKFYLNFKSDGFGMMEVSEPIGFDGIDFNLEQEPKRYGRDLVFSGGSVNFTFTKHRHFEAYKKLMEYDSIYGFESDVEFILEQQGKTFMGNLDFFESNKDTHNAFECMVLQKTSEALIKKREDIVVDLFSTKDLDDNDITAVARENILIKAKPLYQVSKWTFSEPTQDFSTQSGYQTMNPIQQIDLREINNSLTWLTPTGFGNQNSFNRLKTFKLINAKSTLKDSTIRVDLTGSVFSWGGTNVSSNNGASLHLYIKIGLNPTSQDYWDSMNTLYIPIVFENNQVSGSKNLGIYEVSLPEIPVDYNIFLYFEQRFDQTNTGASGVFAKTNLKNGSSVTINANSFGHDTVTRAVKVGDAIKQVVKSIAGLDVVFPMTDANNTLFNHYIFNGNYVRGLYEKPFYLTFKDIKAWFPELNLDFEIMNDSKVYIGTRTDYYTNNEIDVIDTVQFEGYKSYYNERFGLNKFDYAYKNYQAKKENTEEGTFDNVHGESEWHINNKQVENEEVIEVEFIRDPFLLEETKNKALQETKITATQDDDKVFILDCELMYRPQDYTRTRSATLYHEIAGEGVEGWRLILRNDGSFRFDLLGFSFLQRVVITGGENQGSYTLRRVTENEMELTRPTQPTYTGETYTTFDYYIRESISMMNKTGKSGLTLVTGIRNPETYSNLDFSIRQNISNYWLDFLSTANIYSQKNIKNTKYLNNPDFGYRLLVGAPEYIYEKNDIVTLSNPILTPRLVDMTCILSFERFINICDTLRSTTRGFIRTFDVQGNPLYLYPQKMAFIFKDIQQDRHELKLTAEVKNLPNEINITKVGGKYKVFVHDLDKLTYENKNGVITFFDDNGIKIFKPLNFSNIKLNGVSTIDINYFITEINKF